MIITLPKYKANRCRMPYLIDLVEDNVRSRMIYPMIIFVFFIFIMFLVVAPGEIPDTIAYSMEPDTPFKAQYEINSEF